MFVFLRCVAEAALENGLKGLAEMVPGGKYAYEVAEEAWKKYQERKRDAQRNDMVQMAQASFDEARIDAVEAANKALAVVPAAGAVRPAPTPEEIIDLQLYLTAIPESVRQSLKRPEDPTGTTAPAGFALNSVDDLLKLLPARPPQFRSGADLPGKPGWVLDRLLGIGGFGEVWLARHSRMMSLSGAVKFCLGQSGRDLIHEADLINRVMAAGPHPNIVPLRDAHLDGQTPWLLFEYVAGGSMTDWIHQLAGRSKEARLKQVLLALKQLTGAVGCFHGLTPPIAHRDLKPSNILLDRVTNKLRITDFGIGAVTARETLRQESRGQSTRGGRLLSYLHGSHTPLYASPQQRAGGDPDPRDDVHALGVIGYQMLTGHLAQGAGPDFADDLRDAGASEELIALLGKCVAQKPERRPRDARELLDWLAACGSVKAEPVSVQPVSATPKPAASFARLPINPKAAFEEGVKYLYGLGVKQDYACAVELFRQVAEQGYAVAQCNLGGMYAEGLGVKQDYARAVELYRQAAEQGRAVAQGNLGFMYDEGRGVKQDYVRTSELYRQAAEQGNACAQFNLGEKYEKGQGVRQDDARAVELYRQAAAQGYESAKQALARLGVK